METRFPCHKPQAVDYGVSLWKCLEDSCGGQEQENLVSANEEVCLSGVLVESLQQIYRHTPYRKPWIPRVSEAVADAFSRSGVFLVALTLICYASTYQGIRVCMHQSVSFALSVCPSLYVFVCLSVSLFIYLSIFLRICLSIYVSLYLSAFLFVHLSVYLSIQAEPRQRDCETVEPWQVG